MATFFKAQAASITATAVDFAVTIVLKEWLGIWYLIASITGTLSGGLVNFMMNRHWVFKAHDGRIHFQAVKYILVWIGNLILVSGGVFLLTQYAQLSYLVSKVLVSVLVGVFYNYVLQKRFVFK
jgi:putative flippase GtrA